MSNELQFAYTDTFSLKPANQPCMKIVDRALEKHTYSALYKEMPLKRALQMANSGQIDGVLSRTESVAKKYPNLIRVGQSCGELSFHLVTKKSKAFSFTSWDSIPKGYRLGHLRGVTMLSEEIFPANTHVRFVQANSRKQLVSMFIYNKIDMLFVPISGMESFQKTVGDDMVVVKYKALKSALYPFAHIRHKSLFFSGVESR